MPIAAQRPCKFPGCPQLVDSGTCSKHARKYDEARGSASARGYDATWRRLRRMVLAGEPLCRECELKDLVVLAVEVDHIVPLRLGGSRLDSENLQPLCRACHSRKTMRESVGR